MEPAKKKKTLLSWECVISSVLSCHNNLKQQPSDRPCPSSQTDQCYSFCVTAQFYLENKGKYILEAWGHANPKDMKRRERERPLALRLLFLHVFSPPPRPVLCKLGLARSAVCSTWGSHSSPWNFLCSIFTSFPLPCLLTNTFLNSFFLF